jgi:hypothetical protein
VGATLATLAMAGAKIAGAKNRQMVEIVAF